MKKYLEIIVKTILECQKNKNRLKKYSQFFDFNIFLRTSLYVNQHKLPEILRRSLRDT